MSTGAGTMARSKPADVRATGVRFAADRLVVVLADEHDVSVPLRLYPTLRAATPAQRRAWELIGGGRAFHWEDLDLDLSVAGLVNGLREAIPRSPRMTRSKATPPVSDKPPMACRPDPTRSRELPRRAQIPESATFRRKFC